MGLFGAHSICGFKFMNSTKQGLFLFLILVYTRNRQIAHDGGTVLCMAKNGQKTNESKRTAIVISTINLKKFALRSSW